MDDKKKEMSPEMKIIFDIYLITGKIQSEAIDNNKVWAAIMMIHERLFELKRLLTKTESEVKK